MKHLREIRRKKGLSASGLAKAAGLSPMSIYRYETGKRWPDVTTAYRIAKVLNVSIDDLVGKKAG